MTRRRIHVCAGGIRALLVADVARRVEQVSGRQCYVSWAFDEPRAAEFNLYPADEITTTHPTSAFMVNCAHVANSFQTAEFVGSVTGDPLALRLALLELAAEHTDVSGDADETLRRWRSAVAKWARSPGAPPSRPHLESAVAAFSELDTPRGVDMLRIVEADNQLAAGSKFETFAYLDRVVGIDLARDLGS
ncbi:MAG TPA: hypothetical protein VFN80_02625 [Acidothermaceae bacterium]|nr:hypothetical protein [Acidothermaceae bacterium]